MLIPAARVFKCSPDSGYLRGRVEKITPKRSPAVSTGALARCIYAETVVSLFM